MNRETRMPQARNTIISLSDTPYYHCVARCVRRAFLCGVDNYSGNNYNHRRQWLEDKLHATASAFAIKLCTYAVMSNHYHVVLHVRSDLANGWSDREVVNRWHSLFSGNVTSQRFLDNEPIDWLFTQKPSIITHSLILVLYEIKDSAQEQVARLRTW